MVLAGNRARHLSDGVAGVSTLNDVGCLLNETVESTSSAFVAGSAIPSVLASEFAVVVSVVERARKGSVSPHVVDVISALPKTNPVVVRSLGIEEVIVVVNVHRLQSNISRPVHAAASTFLESRRVLQSVVLAGTDGHVGVNSDVLDRLQRLAVLVTLKVTFERQVAGQVSRIELGFEGLGKVSLGFSTGTSDENGHGRLSVRRGDLSRVFTRLNSKKDLFSTLLVVHTERRQCC